MPAPDQVTFTVQTAGVSAYDVNPLVGEVYDVAINGVGYMLADNPARNKTYYRGVVPLDPQRLATSDTPFAQSIDRYNFVAFDDMSGGAGQSYLQRTQSDETMFFDSQGIDPFKLPGQISLLHDVDHVRTLTYTDPHMIVVDDELFVQSDDDALDYTTDGSSWTTLSSITDTSGAVTITGLASDGQYWYAATGSSIIRGLHSDPGADWASFAAADVKWAGGRICAAVIASGSTPNRFTTFTESGTEEVTDGHLTLDTGHTVVLGGATGGYVYFGAFAGNTGSIYAWQLGLDTSSNFYAPFVAWEMPPGLVPSAVGVAGGNVWVKAYQPEGSSAGRAVLYRCVVGNDGSLTPFLVVELAELGGSLDMSGSEIAAQGDYVYFGWREMQTGSSGIGTVSLVSGGWAKGLESGVTGQVTAVSVFHGYPVFSISGHGVYMESSDYLTSGWLQTSYADAGTTLTKVWDRVQVRYEPLPSACSIEVETTGDEGGSFVSAGTADSAGTTFSSLDVAQKLSSIGIRFTFGGDGTDTPVMTAAQAMYHQLGLADEVLVLPIDCADHLIGANGADLQPSGPGTGAARARTLEGLAQARVQVQDIDWQQTGGLYTYEVVKIEIDGYGMFNRHKAGNEWHQIVAVTMRKNGVG